MYISKFAQKKITPNIVCKLSAYDFEMLGIQNRADMIRVRVECVKFGMKQLPRENSDCGAPKFEVLKRVLENLIDNGFSIKEISTLLSILESTVY